MERRSVACDVCGAEKKEVNHWFKVRQTEVGLIFSAPSSKTGKDVCGQACAHKLLDRWMSTGTIEEPVANMEPLCDDKVAQG